MGTPPASHPVIRALPLVAVATVVFAAAVLQGARGDNFDIYLAAAHRFLAGEALYSASGPGRGFLGPPFQALAFVPFAAFAVDYPSLVRWAWDANHAAVIVLGTWAWCRALDSVWPTEAPLWRSPAALAAAVAVAVPFYSDIRNQNVSTVIFCLLGLAALALTTGRAAAAGAMVGLATALKAFPVLAIAYFVWRRQWRSAIVAVVVASGLTLAALAPSGHAGPIDVAREWLGHSGRSSWPVWRLNQSVAAALLRLWPAMSMLTLVAVLGLIVVLLARAVRPGARTAPALDMALVAAVMALLSPIAWMHYFVLLFPAMMVLWVWPGEGRWARRAIVGVVAVLVSGITRLTVGTAGVDLARDLSSCAIAGLAVVIVLSRTIASGPRISELRPS